MSVPKSKRKESQFEVIKHFYRLRKDITDLLLRDFGYSEKKAKLENITRMRRKLKKLVNILNKNDFINYYKAWFRNNYKNMSKQQRENMDTLFYNLMEVYYV